MKKRVLVLGATGMAGHMVFDYFSKRENYEVFGLSRKQKNAPNFFVCDVFNTAELLQTIQDVKPQIIVNCIGALVRESKEHPESAIFLNSYLPHYLKKIAKEVDCRLIHISTDCVFSGTKGNYSETDFRDADDTYGRSKALGEIVDDNNLTIRTSIIGPELKNPGLGLFDWFMQQTGTVNGFTNVFWSGITTLQLAKTIDLAIEKNLAGLYQVTNGNRISKQVLLELFNDIFRKNSVTVLPYSSVPHDKSLVKSEKFDFQVPDYVSMLLELKQWIVDSDIYNYKHLVL